MIFLLIKLFFSLFLVFFLPGIFLLRILFSNKDTGASLLEKFVLAFGLSIFLVNVIAIFLNFFGIPITALSVFGAIVVLCFSFYSISKRNPPLRNYFTQKKRTFFSLHDWSYRNLLTFGAIFILVIGSRMLYVLKGIMPSTTDLGHHMYWSKYIVNFASLPTYGMPDFIIGEHIIFSLISLFSGISLIGPMPVIAIFVVNIFSVLATFILTYRISEVLFGGERSKSISLVALLIIGGFYATSDPQAKFISGGVIGNIIGNLYIPLALYAIVRTITTKNTVFPILFIIFSLSLAFSHHLSTFVFLYILLGSLLISTLLLFVDNTFSLKKTLTDTWKIVTLFLNRYTITALFFSALFVLFVHTPSYLNQNAIDTAMGTPTKSTRVGLSLNNIIGNGGAWRIFYAGIGALVVGYGLLQTQKKKSERKEFSVFSIFAAIILAWAGMIFFMSWKPALLRIDIPSARIVTYITYPLSVLSAIGVTMFLVYAKKFLDPKKIAFLFLLILGSAFVSVYDDVSDTARARDEKHEINVKQTFLASEFLAQNTLSDQNLIKDHIYLEGDTWAKLFFMRGYKYPLSRTYERRYIDPTKNRETCTRDMVAIPDSEIGKSCFSEQGVEFVMLNNGHDDSQFEKSENFDKVYHSNHVVIFQRTNQ